MSNTPTTIDSLQIEITSSSFTVASGIDDLAASLEKLKKNGSFKTVTNNLNSLSDALKNLPNVHSASNSLRTLANSIEKLKGVGSISSISNSLSKLPTALKSIGNINLEKVAPQIRSIADAVAPLSAVKAGGLNTMVNSLRNLDKVADSLSDEAIARFASKVELLSQKLGPLSAKMATIKSGFQSINSSARTAAGGVDKFDKEVNINTFNMANMITVVQGLVAALQPLIRLLVTTIGDAMEWDGIKYQFGNAFGDQADIYYEKITQITDALSINKQAFMENSAMAASMLIGFGVDKADAREMGVGYTELAYDIWAAFNNVYKTLDGADGAMAAVRSAIAGEVEPIRRAGFTIVESQLEQTAANHGLAISIETATEAQKSYLRYLELVDQAQKKGVVGTYAREMQTAEGMTRTFTQQLKTLGQAFGSLFLPILVKVMPYLQAFVELLTEGVHWIASLFGVEIQDIGDTWNDYSVGASVGAENTDQIVDGLDQATKKAKALKNAAIGIDELNVISPTAASSDAGSGAGSGGAGGGGFSGLPIDSIWDSAILDGIKQDVDDVKEKIRGWMPVIAAAAAALAGLRLTKLISDLGIIAKGGALISGAVTAFKFIKEYIMAAIAMAPEVGWFAALFPKISTFFATISPLITKAATAIGTFLGGISAPVWATIVAIIAAVGSAVYFLAKNWDEVVQATKNWIDLNIVPIFEEFKTTCLALWDALVTLGTSLWNLIPEGLQNLILGIVDAVKEAVVFFWELFASVEWLKAIGTVIEWLGGIVVGILGGAIGGAIAAVLNLLESAVQIITGAVQIVSGILSGLANLIVGVFTGDFGAALDSAILIWEGIKNVFLGAADAVLGTVWALFKGIIDWFVELCDELVGHSIVPDTVNAIVKWFTSLPSKIFKSIDDFVSGIISKFKGLWSKLVSWWNGKTKLKEYTPSIGSIYDKVKSRWDSARTWWNEKKSAMKSYTPSIGSIYEKVYDRWKNARDWWNSKKGSFKTYTPSIGSITDKLKSAWNSAKKWWQSNVKLSIPSLSFKVTYSNSGLNVAQKAIVKALSLNGWPKLSFAANGGIFDQGSLIWAGERGPEVMARAAGGKTGVMNVQQMQDAVYEGVYSAVVAAMRGQGGGGGQDIHVYLDGREISASVRKHQRESGAALMGNEVYAY